MNTLPSIGYIDDHGLPKNLKEKLFLKHKVWAVNVIEIKMLLFLFRSLQTKLTEQNGISC